MRIKLNASELKEVLDKHFGGIDTLYELDLQEDSFAINTRVGKEKIARMPVPPETKNVALRAIFPNMSVIVVVKDIIETNTHPL